MARAPTALAVNDGSTVLSRDAKNSVQQDGRTSQIRTGDLYHVKALATHQDTLGRLTK